MLSRRPALALATALLTLAGSACDDITGLDDAILIENESGITITRVYIRDCDSTDWGADQLDAEEVIGPNDTRGFDVGDGCYDLRAVFLAGGETTRSNVEVEDGDQFVWRIDSPSGTILIENSATASVHYLYMARCGDDTWGPDELGDDDTIPPGDDMTFEVLAGCWDLRAQFSDDSFAEEFGIDLDDGEDFTWELVD